MANSYDFPGTQDSTNYATLLGALFPDPHPSALLEQVIASFSPSGYWRSIFERRAGMVLDFVKQQCGPAPNISTKDIVGVWI